MVITKDDIQHSKTPCLVLDKDEPTKCISDLQTALDTQFDNNVIGYSIRANALPYYLKVAKDSDCFTEAVSSQEYELALKIGYDKRRTIYDGPLKSRQAFSDAIQRDAIVNIETRRRIGWLDDLSKNREHDMGIRLNINTTSISTEDAFGENDDSYFSFSYESNDFQRAVELIGAKRYVWLVGMHTRKEPKTRSVRSY